MEYNFDEIIPRRGTNSIKWDNDNARNCLPLWVADMDFRAAEPIRKALAAHIEHGIFGYAHIPDEYYDAVINWFARRHNWHISREHILCTNGIVPALSAILQAMTDSHGTMTLPTPAYNCFFESPANAGRKLALAPMKVVNRRYEMDWDVLENQLKGAQMTILCNPHNPTGRVWSKDELQRFDELCNRHNVFVMADEIHNGLAFPGHDYIPYATVATGTNWCACTSCTKSFNIAGLPIANIIIPDSQIRKRIAQAVFTNRIGDITALSLEALMAAYNDSEDWLDQVRAYIYGNYMFMSAFFSEHLPQLQLMKMEGTYLAWADVRATGMTATDFCSRLAAEHHVLFNAGKMYGDDNYIRINMACPRATLAEALNRLRLFLQSV